MAIYKIGDKVKINYPQATKIHGCIGTIVKVEVEAIKDFATLTKYLVEIVNTNNKTIKTILSENRLEKIVDISEELTRKCLFENADALDNHVTISNNGISFSDGYTVTKLYTDASITTTSVGISSIKDEIDNYFTKKKESEENKMKEILNQKVVDLYFERKKKLLDNAYLEDVMAVEKIDPNRVFVEELKKQFDEHVGENADKNNVLFNVSLPLTEGCAATIAELKRQYNDNKKQLEENKEEILAMLSGCETYDQELVVLKNYYIVNDNNTLMPA